MKPSFSRYFFLILLLGCSSQYTAYSEKAPPVLAASSGPTVAGTITVDPKLAKKISPTDTIYIMAKQGMGPPLAVKKVAAGQLPLSFELGPSDVMMQGMPFEGEVTIVARVDKDGMAGPPQPGDLEGKTSQPVRVGDQSVAVKIDKRF